MSVCRWESNPIIKPGQVKASREDFEVICVFNAGVVRWGDEVFLLLRIAERPVNMDPDAYLSPCFDEDKGELVIHRFDRRDPQYDFSDSRVITTARRKFLTSISHFRVARSKDGINFSIEDRPSMAPSNSFEMYGIEDPRITFLEGVYYISYSAISEVGITACLASTTDFKEFKRHGAIFHPDNKDIAIFPEKAADRYFALHRPSISHFGTPDIWIAESPDLICWGNHRHVAGTRDGYWDDGRVGAGAVPFRVGEGWLEIYHGADRKDRYCLGALLLDEKEPWKVLARSRRPFMEPQEEYEAKGFFGNVIFSCGVLFEEQKVKIYYGAADTSIAYAEVGMEDILAGLERV